MQFADDRCPRPPYGCLPRRVPTGCASPGVPLTAVRECSQGPVLRRSPAAGRGHVSSVARHLPPATPAAARPISARTCRSAMAEAAPAQAASAHENIRVQIRAAGGSPGGRDRRVTPLLGNPFRPAGGPCENRSSECGPATGHPPRAGDRAQLRHSTERWQESMSRSDNSWIIFGFSSLQAIHLHGAPPSVHKLSRCEPWVVVR